MPHYAAFLKSVGLPLVLASTLLLVPSPGAAQQAAASSIAGSDLRVAAKNNDVRTFYEANGWASAWSSQSVDALRQALGTRDRHGLDRMAFDEPKEQASAAERDVGWTRAALSYASALARGAVDPADLHDVYTLARPDVDVGKQLAEALAQERLKEWLAGLAPDDEDYRALGDAYRSYAGEVRVNPRIADGEPIHGGDVDPRVADISALLAANGYLDQGALAEPDGPDGATYTQQIADAVKELQRDYGIRVDGVVGPDTREVLNLGPEDKARALAVALERRRWLPRTAPPTRIDVNTAAARLRYYRSGKLVDERKVIVGKPDWETPALSAPIFRLVANPTWTVPKSIERETLSGKSAAWLRRNNMVRRRGFIVQQPGPDNALGLVKFDMRNDQAIYLHDTSNPSLFGRSQRHLSHGCVRVADATAFAAMIAEAEGVSEQWREASASKKQTFIDLPEEIPVRLLYANAFVGSGGKVTILTDPYGWNGAVAEKLGFESRKSTTARVGQSDVGP